MGSPWATPPPPKKIFFSEITKSDHKLSKLFYFNKLSYVLAELRMFFYFMWCFLLKRVIFSHNSCGRKFLCPYQASRQASVFCNFCWPKSGKNLALTSFKFGISSYKCHKFPLRLFYNHNFLLLKVFPK